MRRYFLLVVIIMLFIVISCEQESSEKESINSAEMDALLKQREKTIKKAFALLPPPEQILNIIKSETPKLERDLFPTNYAKSAEDPRQIASLMGIYLADVSYLTLHNQMQSALKYMEVLQKLAVKLRVEDIFSVEVMKKAEKYKEHPDSIKRFVTQMYGKLLIKLRETGQEELIDYITFFAWNEAVYLTTKFLPYSKNKKIIEEKLIEQKILLPLMEETLMEGSKQDIKQYLDKYNKAYANVSIEYKQAQGVEEKGNVLVVKNANEIQYSQDDITKIAQVSSEVRQNVINI